MHVWIVIALAGNIAPALIPDTKPRWQTDYFEARAVAMERGKPLAVFLGNNATGWEKGIRDGQDLKVNQLLHDNYVCVYVRTDSPEGRKLASAFEVTGRGLVISDRKGGSQQFHHSGDLSQENLMKALTRYADPQRSFRTTETVAQLNPPPVRTYQPTYRLSGG